MIGTKAAVLADLMQAGFRVPAGFVVTTKAARSFFQAQDLDSVVCRLLRRHNALRSDMLVKTARSIRTLIMSSRMPAAVAREVAQRMAMLGTRRVAVRSSALHEDLSRRSLAGLFDSFLNVKRSAVLSIIKRCWASAFSARALAYYANSRSAIERFDMPVLVQLLVPAQVSGVCFTTDPRSFGRRTVIIEACYGLAEGLVGGRLTPDRYVLSRRTGQLIETRVSSQTHMLSLGATFALQKTVARHLRERAKLSPAQAMRLMSLCVAIADRYGVPQDVEWVLARRHFFIVQSRPITTLCTSRGIRAVGARVHRPSRSGFDEKRH